MGDRSVEERTAQWTASCVAGEPDSGAERPHCFNDQFLTNVHTSILAPLHYIF